MSQIHIDPSVITHWNDAIRSMETPWTKQYNSYKPLEELDELDLMGFVNWLEGLGNIGPRNLAWNTGLEYDVSGRGVIGKTIFGSKTVGSALRKICQYFPLIQDNSILKLSVDGDLASLSYKILDPEIWPRHQDAMYTLGVYVGFLTRAAPDLWSKIEVLFEAPRNTDTALVSNKLSHDCLYNQGMNVINFPASVLDNPMQDQIPSAPSSATYLSKCLVAKNRNMPMGARVRLLILEGLETGPVRQKDIAGKIGMTSRTLRRRLTAEGLSFQQVLDECRMQIVTLEFRTKKIVSLSETALKLGYSEHSTFSRAFSRWTGLAPQEYRKAINQTLATN